MSKGPDFTQIARRAVDQVTGEDKDKRRNPAAVELGKLGGRAATAKLTPAQRSERARKGANATNAKKAAEREGRSV